jgi:hypothetical protein
MKQAQCQKLIHKLNFARTTTSTYQQNSVIQINSALGCRNDAATVKLEGRLVRFNGNSDRLQHFA